MNNKQFFRFNEKTRLFNGWIAHVDDEMLFSAFLLYSKVFELRNSNFNELEVASKRLVLAYQNLKFNDLIYFLCRLMIHFCSNSSYKKVECRKLYHKWVRAEFGFVCKENYINSLIDLFDYEYSEKHDQLASVVDSFSEVIFKSIYN